MTSTDAEASPALVDFARSALQRWRMIALTMVVAAGVVFFVVHRKPVEYSASALVSFPQSELNLPSLVGVQFSDVGGTQTTALATAATLGVTQSVAQAASRDLDGKVSPAQVYQDMSASASTTANIVTFSASNPSPQLAEAIANAYANAYVTSSTGQLTSQITSAQARIASQLTTLAGSHNPAAAGEVAELRERQAELNELLALQSPPAAIGSYAHTAKPSTITPVKAAILAAIIALVAALFLAFVIERTDPRLLTGDEIADYFGTRFIGVASTSQGRLKRRRSAPGLSVVDQRKLLARLLIGTEDCPRMLAISSAEAADTPTTVATVVSLARTCAGSGVQVSVVDLTDSDGAILSQLGWAEPTEVPQLSAILNGDLAMSTALEVRTATDYWPDDRISVISCGDASVDHLDPGVRARVQELLDELRLGSDIVIAVAPPLASSRDLLFVLTERDQMLLLVPEGARLRALGKLRVLLEELPVRLIGILV
ncbi:MAG: hypothetical protein ACLP50_27595 [Solirubrobacteraceae bacterium]